MAHPRSAAWMALVVLSMAYVLISAPRNGIVISAGGNGIFRSMGFTTVLSPPTEYVSRYILSDAFDQLETSVPRSSKKGTYSSSKWQDVFSAKDGEKDGVHVIPLNKQQKKKVSMAILARKTVPFEVLLPSEEELELLHEREKNVKEHRQVSDEELMQMVEEKAWEDCVHLAFQSAESIVAARRFAEFIHAPASSSFDSSNSRIKFIARGDKKEKAALVVKSMGVWKRYGIQPLKIAAEEMTQDSSSVVYYTLQGGHFDGQLKVSVEKDKEFMEEEDDDDDENDDKTTTATHPRITVTVSLWIPKGGRKIPTPLASQMVSMLAESITTSIMTAAKQTLSRKLQSTIYRDKAKSRAIQKRHVAFETMQKMEEMAADRRRRWQRNNRGSGGTYRPSGCRPPEGGPRFGF